MAQWKNYPFREVVTDDGHRVADDVADALKVISVGASGGKREVVKPMVFSSSFGESRLTKGYEDHGLGYLQGYGWRCDVHYPADGGVLTIPLDIKLKDIASANWLEKCGTTDTDNNTLNVIFQIDYDENGAFTETSDDRFLFTSWRGEAGHTSWTKVDGLGTTAIFYLYDGAWAQKATPDGTIAAGTLATFAAFKATNLGDYRVKAMQIIYTGEKTGHNDFWVQAANFSFNGVFYELQPMVQGVHRRRVVVTKVLIAGVHSAGTVVAAEAAVEGGTDWDFNFGGPGYITKAIISHDAAITARFDLYLFNTPLSRLLPDENAFIELDALDTFNSPTEANLPYYIGKISFPAMSYSGSGDAIAQCTPSTVGGLPLSFETPDIYGVLVAVDEVTIASKDCSIFLTAEVEG